MFEGRFVWLVQDEQQLILEGAEKHAVASVAVKERDGIHAPVTGDVAVVGAGNAFRVAGLRHARPEHDELPALEPVEEGAVGDIDRAVPEPVGDALDPGLSVGSVKERHRFSNGLLQVPGELHRADLAVPEVGPLMAEDHVRDAVRGEVEGAVEAVPLLRRDLALAPELKGPQRAVGADRPAHQKGLGIFKGACPAAWPQP